MNVTKETRSEHHFSLHIGMSMPQIIQYIVYRHTNMPDDQVYCVSQGISIFWYAADHARKVYEV